MEQWTTHCITFDSPYPIFFFNYLIFFEIQMQRRWWKWYLWFVESLHL